jgi:FkbM family methyltransferase
VSVLELEVYDTHYKIKDPGGIIGKALQSGEPYEAKVLYHIYRKQLSGLAVDVGAGIGNHSLFFSCVCGLDVMAFEPVDYDRLLENIDLNKMRGKIKPKRLALGSKSGRAREIDKNRLEMSLSGPYMVERLDHFKLEDVSLLKIDVENMEYDVLVGAQETIERERPLIFVETWDDDAHNLVESILRPMGYRHRQTYGATPLEEWCPRQ